MWDASDILTELAQSPIDKNYLAAERQIGGDKLTDIWSKPINGHLAVRVDAETQSKAELKSRKTDRF